jgi:hypothetical protein
MTGMFTLHPKDSCRDPLKTPARVFVGIEKEWYGKHSRSLKKILGVFLLFTAPAGCYRVHP